MVKYVVPISELEAVPDFAALLLRLSPGEEIVIEDDSRPVAVVHSAQPMRRTISEAIALAEAHAKESGLEPTMDPDFAEDIAEIIKNRKPRNLPAWE
jgi:antitoxin (DNA-binding transcriptional repressor) of toxin-antitoxin stability system